MASEVRKGRFVIQNHFRGISVHTDLRILWDNDTRYTGWTLFTEKTDTLKHAVTNVKDGKTFSLKTDAMKIDFKAGKFLESRLGATPKESGDRIWMQTEGVISRGKPGAGENVEGVIVILDQGELEGGYEDGGVFEYFLNGRHFKGRLVFIQVRETGAIPQDAVDVGKAPTHNEMAGKLQYIAVQPEDQTPHVLGDGFWNSSQLIPSRPSMPEKYIAKVPEHMKFWNESGDARRMTLRDLRAYFSTNKTIKSEKVVGLFQCADNIALHTELIVGMLPEHTTFVELFSYDETMFTSRQKSEREIVRYTDPYTGACFARIVGLTDEEAEEMRSAKYEYTADNVQRAKDILAKKERTTTNDLWARLVAKNIPTDGESIFALRSRLAGVEVTKLGWKEAIKQYDSPETLFFVDLPKEVSLFEIKKAMKEAKGKFLVITMDRPNIDRVLGDTFLCRKTARKHVDFAGKMESEHGFVISNYAMKSEQYEGESVAFSVDMEFRSKERLEEGIVGGIVYYARKEDTDGEWAEADTNFRAMVDFMMGGASVSIRHKTKVDARVVEMFQAEKDTEKGGGIVPAGAVWASVKILDRSVIELVKKGELRGFSWDGMIQVEPGVAP